MKPWNSVICDVF